MVTLRTPAEIEAIRVSGRVVARVLAAVSAAAYASTSWTRWPWT
ncbi:hypothetical protein QEZ54_10410 [Catellatospora sp. KI3]|nr:hypothetical protein [Catellatospora sp. KI3]MDI1461381.1 hypothetical protein [Catellatospora sp. KI3]